MSVKYGKFLNNVKDNNALELTTLIGGADDDGTGTPSYSFDVSALQSFFTSDQKIQIEVAESQAIAITPTDTNIIIIFDYETECRFDFQDVAYVPGQVIYGVQLGAGSFVITQESLSNFLPAADVLYSFSQYEFVKFTFQGYTEDVTPEQIWLVERQQNARMLSYIVNNISSSMSSKTSYVAADDIIMSDSEASNILKKITVADFKNWRIEEVGVSDRVINNSDSDVFILMESSSPQTITLSNAVTYKAGQMFIFKQQDTGQLSVVVDEGISIEPSYIFDNAIARDELIIGFALSSTVFSFTRTKHKLVLDYVEDELFSQLTEKTSLETGDNVAIFDGAASDVMKYVDKDVFQQAMLGRELKVIDTSTYSLQAGDDRKILLFTYAGGPISVSMVGGDLVPVGATIPIINYSGIGENLTIIAGIGVTVPDSGGYVVNNLRSVLMTRLEDSEDLNVFLMQRQDVGDSIKVDYISSRSSSSIEIANITINNGAIISDSLTSKTEDGDLSLAGDGTGHIALNSDVDAGVINSTDISNSNGISTDALTADDISATTENGDLSINGSILGNVITEKSQDGNPVKYTVSNTSNTASSSAQIITKVSGATADDAKHVFTVNSVASWAIGLDNSDSDKFKISASENLGTSDIVSVSSTGMAINSGTEIATYLEEVVSGVTVSLGDSTTRTCTIKFSKLNNIVTLTIGNLSGFLNTSTTVAIMDFGTPIPAAYRPALLRRADCLYESGSDIKAVSARIATDGGLRLITLDSANFATSTNITANGQTISYDIGNF